MSPGHKVLWACCQGNITAVLWCVFILSVSSPRAGTPLTTVLPAGSLRQKCFDICSTQTCRHKQAQPQTDGTHKHCTRPTHRKLIAHSWSQVKCCFASPSLLLLPPLPSSPPHSSSFWLPRTRRPAVQWDTIYHCRNNYWRHFIVRKFQTILPHPSLFILLLLCFLAVFLSSFALLPPPLFSLLPLLCLFAWLPMSSIAGQTPISPSTSL